MRFQKPAEQCRKGALSSRLLCITSASGTFSVQYLQSDVASPSATSTNATEEKADEMSSTRVSAAFPVWFSCKRLRWATNGVLCQSSGNRN